MEKLLLGNWLVHKYSWQASTHFHRICHCKLLPFHIWRTTTQHYQLCQETHQDHQSRWKRNSSLQRITLGEKRQWWYVWHNDGKLWWSRSMQTSWTYYLERPCTQIWNKQHLTLQGWRTDHLQEHHRPLSRKDTERNNNALQGTRTENNNSKQLKISWLPHSTWRMDFSNHAENQTMSCFTSTQHLATHPLSSNYYLQPSITDYQPYHPTKKHSTKLSLS